ncbi:MAG: aldo/keto reductase [Parachlamydiales bacterium]|nr:aldo/keto reductase [Parachlamydiales bacterium]
MKLSVPLGIGTLHFGSLLDRAASRKVILRAIDKGVSFFDTAPLYGNSLAEEILGDVLLEVHEKVLIATKVGLCVSKRRDQTFGVEVARLNASNLISSVESSLKRLKRESIDLLMLHAFDPSTPIAETLNALVQLHEQGKIKKIGCSNYNPVQLQHLLKKVPDNLPFVAAQCHYNMIERRAGRKFIPLCEQNEVWVVVNRALARGALTGQYVLGQRFRNESRAAMSPRIQKWLTPQKLKTLDSLSFIAKESGTTLTKISLKWLLKNHSQMIVLLGVRNCDQMEECLQTVSSEIDTAVFEKIEALLRNELDVYKLPSRYFEK